MKKLIVIGRGTGGAISAAYFNKFLPKDWIVEWHYDPSIEPQAVGEGLNLVPVQNLSDTLSFEHYNLAEIDGTFKTGIFKKNWGEKGVGFFHTFPPPQTAWHINAVKLQNYIFNYLKSSPRVTFVEANSDSSKLDADFIVDCSGRPNKEQLQKDFHVVDYIPVNAVHVTQCFWDNPRFQYSLTNAHEAGWYFGIPLQNRCAIGLLYNNNFNTLDEVKEIAKGVIAENNLVASDKTNSFAFDNYYRKTNFVGNVAYNGNASFFLEPLEATTIGTMVETCNAIKNIIDRQSSYEEANFEYKYFLHSVGVMIMLHYYAGSIYKTPFWNHAENNGKMIVHTAYKKSREFREHIDDVLRCDKFENSITDFAQTKYHFRIKHYGTWWRKSFFQNIDGLGIRERLKKELYGS